MCTSLVPRTAVALVSAPDSNQPQCGSLPVSACDTGSDLRRGWLGSGSETTAAHTKEHSLVCATKNSASLGTRPTCAPSGPHIVSAFRPAHKSLPKRSMHTGYGTKTSPRIMPEGSHTCVRIHVCEGGSLGYHVMTQNNDCLAL